MDVNAWALPVVVAAALFITITYFMGRRHNVLLMRLYAQALEKAFNPVDQKYTWLGGYLGYRAEYKVKDEYIKAVKASLHLFPRMSLLYRPIARFTMRHDKMYLVFECKQSLPGEAHLMKKGQYRFVPAGIDRVEQFRRRDVTLGGVEFELLHLDSRGEKELLRWAEALKVTDYSRVKHLSFTSSTNVAYAYFDPDEEMIAAVARTAPEFVRAIAK